MLDARLILNGQEFPVPCRLLGAIARNLAESENYAPLAQALLALGIPSITHDLVLGYAASQSITALDAIWKKAALELRRTIADQDLFLRDLTDAQAWEIIDMNDPPILKSLAGHAEMLCRDRYDFHAWRLSPEMADSLLEFIATHPDDSVRRALAENPLAPAKFRPAFSDLARQGLEPSQRDLWRLRPDDLEALKAASVKLLKFLASNIEQIEDLGTQEKVIDFLSSYPDPAIRFELADNITSTKAPLRRLAEDPDADVARAAREQLEFLNAFGTTGHFNN